MNQAPKLNQPIMMTGFGCFGVSVYPFFDEYENKTRYLASTNGRGDKRLRIGDAQISDTLSEPYRQNDPMYQGFIESHSFTNGSGAKLCSGDSGGPLYNMATVQNPNINRRIIGVNSGVGSKASDTQTVKIVSKFTDLNEKTISDFVHKYLKDNPEAKICGVNVPAGTNRCRD